MVVDFHNHVLPGIDDGARTLDDSVAMLENFAALGFKKVIASPHSMADGYINSTEKILAARDVVRTAIAEKGIDIQFDAAAEYYMDELFMEKIEKRDLLTVGKNYVLMELSYLSKPTNTADAIYKLQVAGYNLILAHPERYPYYHEESFAHYKEFKNRGVYFQINLGSLVGKYGAGAKYTAEKMIDENLVEFVGSDLHTLGQFNMLRDCLKQKHLEKILTSDKLRNKTLL
jgi:tyrosine-protein phosphatase YwqE